MSDNPQVSAFYSQILKKSKVLIIGHVKVYNKSVKMLLTLDRNYTKIILENEQLFERKEGEYEDYGKWK